jgi:hypothetical protein
MKPNLIMAIILPIFLSAVSINTFHGIDKNANGIPSNKLGENPYHTVGDIPVPSGYKRISVQRNSFGCWLRNIALKRSRIVYLYDGSAKKDQTMQFAVLDLSIGNKDLQQCADAVMRLRAEYFFSQNKFDEINFRDNNNTHYKFSAPHYRNHFDQYLENVFRHCGTLSLERELHPIRNIDDVQPGDVLIQGGSPGHAMLVIDMAKNNEEKKVFLLMQGYMPAQDIHIVVNPSKPNLNPWYELSNDTCYTPGWIFPPDHFRTW